MDKVFVEKDNTHLIFKEDDLYKHLTPTEREILAILHNKVYDARISLGKKDNQYYIINKDEPYANDILEAIKRGELSKGKPLPICLEDKIAYRLKDICDYRAMYLVDFQYGRVNVEELNNEDLTRNLKQPTLFDTHEE